jgi:type III secretory pathway component EscS
VIEKFVRAFLVIFILVALAVIVATILGFSVQIEEFLENLVPTRLPNHGEFRYLYQYA